MRRDDFTALESADLAAVCGGHGPTTDDIKLQLTQLTDSMTSVATNLDKKTAKQGQTMQMMSMMGR